MTAPNVEYGDRRIAFDNEILRSVVGSGVHGLAIEGTDDNDEMGVYIEPLEHVLGIGHHREDYTSRTKPEGERSEPGDTDLVIYALRKYLRLAIKGNPTALLPMWAPESDLLICTDAGWSLRDSRHWFLSRDAVERFLGYMQGQHERMLGFGKRNRVPTRPELIEKYGWDVKYGSHALRLAYQGHEIAFSGKLTLPLEDETREHVLAVKRGERTKEEVSSEITALAEAVRKLLDSGSVAVRDKPNYEAIQAWAISTQKYHWGL